jgi:hypothetical protein
VGKVGGEEVNTKGSGGELQGSTACRFYLPGGTVGRKVIRRARSTNTPNVPLPQQPQKEPDWGGTAVVVVALPLSQSLRLLRSQVYRFGRRRYMSDVPKGRRSNNSDIVLKFSNRPLIPTIVFRSNHRHLCRHRIDGRFTQHENSLDTLSYIHLVTRLQIYYLLYGNWAVQRFRISFTTEIIVLVYNHLHSLTVKL